MLEISDQKKVAKLLYDINQLCKIDDVYILDRGIVKGKNFIGWFDFPDIEGLTKAQGNKIATLQTIEELSITVDSDLLFQTHRENTKFFEGLDTERNEMLYKGMSLKFYPGHISGITKEILETKVEQLKNDCLFEMDLTEEKPELLKDDIIDLVYDDYKAHLPSNLFFSRPTSKSEIILYPLLRDEKGIVFDTFILERYRLLFFTLLQRVTVVNY